jgi:2,4-dienoyl-CoA reductase-like NADH-dependent reductase (Old Yellow Enzyme family)
MARPWYGNGPLSGEDHARGDKPWSIVAPTAKPVGEGWITPRKLQAGDLQHLKEAYRQATRRAHAAGFDIVEVHAAHGYLLHSFLSPLSNEGAFEERTTFPLEVAKVVRDAWPAQKPVFLRVSSIDDVEGGWTIEDTVRFAKELKSIGVDVIDCSSGGILGSATAATRVLVPRVPGFQLPFAETVRRETGLRTMAVGLIITPKQAEEALAAGRADLIAIGREALWDPNWPVHAAQALDADPDFARWPVQYGWWLTRRETLLKKQGFKRP